MAFLQTHGVTLASFVVTATIGIIALVIASNVQSRITEYDQMMDDFKRSQRY